jgi:hypothetical protein
LRNEKGSDQKVQQKLKLKIPAPDHEPEVGIGIMTLTSLSRGRILPNAGHLLTILGQQVVVPLDCLSVIALPALPLLFLVTEHLQRLWIWYPTRKIPEINRLGAPVIKMGRPVATLNTVLIENGLVTTDVGATKKQQNRGLEAQNPQDHHIVARNGTANLKVDIDDIAVPTRKIQTDIMNPSIPPIDIHQKGIHFIDIYLVTIHQGIHQDLRQVGIHPNEKIVIDPLPPITVYLPSMNPTPSPLSHLPSRQRIKEEIPVLCLHGRLNIGPRGPDIPIANIIVPSHRVASMETVILVNVVSIMKTILKGRRGKRREIASRNDGNNLLGMYHRMVFSSQHFNFDMNSSEPLATAI